MTARRPADIAVDLREHAGRTYGHNLLALADELDGIEATHVLVPKDRWPSAGEIADLRAGVARVGELASVLPTAWQKNELRTIRANLAAFLDRLEPPAEPQGDDDVDPVVSLNVPLSAVQALWGGMEAGQPLDWIPALHAFGDAARAALDAQGQS